MTESNFVLHGVPIKVISDNPQINYLLSDYLQMYRQEYFPQSPKSLVFKFEMTENAYFCTVPQEEILFNYDKITSWQRGGILYLSDGYSLIKGSLVDSFIEGFVHHDTLKDKVFFTRVFFGLIFFEALRFRGLYQVHAAALVKNGVCFLFPADAGSGKSTVAMNLLKEGWFYISDDTVFLKSTGSLAEVLGFTHEFRLACSEEEEKKGVNILSIYPELYLSSCVPKFIFFLFKTGEEETKIEKITSTEAFALLVRHSLLVMMDKRVAPFHAEMLKQVVQQAKCYKLLSGKDIHYNSVKLNRILEETTCQT